MWLTLWMVVAPAQAQALDTCQQVRNVRALAVRDGLDDRALRQLEARYCVAGRPVSTPGGPPARPRPGHSGRPPRGARSADCTTLMLMEGLHELANGELGQRAAIAQEVQVACGMNTNEALRSWPGGLTMKSSSGAWTYPNGLTARSSSGALSYPNGMTARSSSGAWSYPSGMTALSSSGRWSRPDGLTVDGEQSLMSWACGERPDACSGWMQGLAMLDGDARSMRLMAIAWEASGR